MNKNESIGLKYLLDNGYQREEIAYMGNEQHVPDFECKDGKRFEVKSINKGYIFVTMAQLKKFKEEDQVILVHKGKVMEVFCWKDLMEGKKVNFITLLRVTKRKKESKQKKKKNDRKKDSKKATRILGKEKIKKELEFLVLTQSGLFTPTDIVDLFLEKHDESRGKIYTYLSEKIDSLKELKRIEFVGKAEGTRFVPRSLYKVVKSEN